MSSEALIQATGLGKAYAIFSSPADRLKQMLARGTRRRYFKEFWALRDVNLTIGRGETVGIVGRNGSGKSTLLKLLCGVLQPTTGTLNVTGRIAALLELGAGFNPEFTGRENVILSASLLGLPEEDIAARIDEMIAFADIGDFLDRPVRTYSSGMFARLAFAVSIHVDPDILIIDEALAVGDAAFQHKCFGRLNAMKERGTTILFVSHSASSVLELCDRAVLIHHGELVLDGTPRFIIQSYRTLTAAHGGDEQHLLGLLRQSQAAQEVEQEADDEGDDPDSTDPNVLPDCWFDPDLKSETAIIHAENGARITDLKLLGPDGRQANIVTMGSTCTVSYRVEFTRDAHAVVFGTHFRTATGQRLAGQQIPPPHTPIRHVHAGQSMDLSFPFTMRMTPGSYTVTVGAWSLNEDPPNLHWIVEGLLIRVVDSCKHSAAATIGMVDLSIGHPEIRPVTASQGG